MNNIHDVYGPILYLIRWRIGSQCITVCVKTQDVYSTSSFTENALGLTML